MHLRARWGLLLVLSCSSGPQDASGGGPGGGAPGTQGPGGGGQSPASSERLALSGSRLKNRLLRGEDGSLVWVGFFDSLRNENCVFQRTPDGAMRCLPLESVIPFSGSFSTSPTCQGGDIQKVPCGDPNGLFVTSVPVTNGYGVTSTNVLRGREVQRPSRLYLGGGPQDCTDVTWTIEPTDKFAQLYQIELSDFVSGRFETGP